MSIVDPFKGKKKTTSLRLYDFQRKLIEKEFGNLQVAVDFFCDMIERHGRKNFLKYIKSKLERDV